MWAALWLVPAIAVLPLRDVDGDAAARGIAAAMRAVLEQDLAALHGITVRDGRAVDRALAAEKIDPAVEPDADAIKRLGRALDAQVLITGAFKRGAPGIKLWVRFMRQSGKLGRTATAGGPASDVLLMLNTVEGELLREAGAPRQTVASTTYRLRPRLRSLRTLELYGEALGEPDSEKRKHLLQLALDADPTFTHAARELEALDHQPPTLAMREAAEQLKERIKSEKDPAKVTEHYVVRFAELQKQRRYRTLIAEAGAIVQNPPSAVADLTEQLPETAQYLMVAAYDQLNDDDAVVREGQRFMARYPLSDGFVGVRQLVDAALERKKQRDDGRAPAAAAIEKLTPAERDNPCRVAEVLEDHHQLTEARQAFERCVSLPGPHDRQLVQLMFICHRQSDFRAVGLLLERLKKESPASFKRVMHIADELPID